MSNTSEPTADMQSMVPTFDETTDLFVAIVNGELRRDQLRVVAQIVSEAAVNCRIGASESTWHRDMSLLLGELMKTTRQDCAQVAL